MTDYLTVDVFTDKPFGGNPLAVIPDARAIPDDRLQSIAREFNYSETTFVYPPDDPAHTARVRIFTPTDELPFAGHPNVGTAFVLGRSGQVFGKAVDTQMVFEEKAGLVAVDLLREAGEVVGARIVAPQALELGEELDPQLVADCVGLQARDIVTGAHRPRFASVGLPVVMVELSDLAALAAARPHMHAFAEADARHGRDGDPLAVYLYVRTDGADLRARMFAPLSNIPEDPATGSAAAALGALLGSLAPQPDLAMQVTIAQGIEMGRPSTIAVDIAKQSGTVARVGVAGRCVPMMQGQLHPA